MRRVRKFLRMSAGERALLIQAAVLLAAIRLGFSLLSFDRLRRRLARWEKVPRSTAPPDPDLVRRIVESVRVAAKYVPGARTCLMQALAAKTLMSRKGVPGRLHIGVARGEKGEFQAHAWVEYEGQVVIGGEEDISAYTLLPPLESEKE